MTSELQPGTLLDTFWFLLEGWQYINSENKTM